MSTVKFAIPSVHYDDALQRWLGKKEERYLFSVMTSDGDKRLYTSPYDYEKYTLQLVKEATVEQWKMRLAALAEGKWPAGLPETREWGLNFPEERRQEMLEENAYEIPLAVVEDEEGEDGSWW
jgi:hypothetical protein